MYPKEMKLAYEYVFILSGYCSTIQNSQEYWNNLCVQYISR